MTIPRCCQLNRAQRLQMQMMADRGGRVTQTDHGFFERLPYRQHRVRDDR